jgi:hypothetical protein
LTRASSRFTWASSSSFGRPGSGNAWPPSALASRHQRDTRFGLIPSSRATWLTRSSLEQAHCTASCLYF